MAKTHTLRSRKVGGKILTFTPGFEASLASAHPYAASLTIELVLARLKSLGLVASLDMEQSGRLEAAGVGRAVESSANAYRGWVWLSQGAQGTTLEPEQLLGVLDDAAKRLLGDPSTPNTGVSS